MTAQEIPRRLSGPIIRLNPDGSVTPSISITIAGSETRTQVVSRPELAASTLSESLDASLQLPMPTHLWHYSSADGLIGILRSRELWASSVTSLNDTKEIIHAVDYAKQVVSNRLSQGGLTTEETKLLEELSRAAGTAAKRFYVASFSEERDLLSQWRAYCPSGGGYSLGMPSLQVVRMAVEQDFLLAPCIYDHVRQYKVLSEITESFLLEFQKQLISNSDLPKLRAQLALRFAQHIARLGLVLKHPTFSEEREWRLISPVIPESHPQLDFRGDSTRVIPFFRFKLSSSSNPNFLSVGDSHLTTIVGPTSDRDSSSLAVQSLMVSLFGTASFGVSDIPFRAW